MILANFVAQNELEAALEQARSGRLSIVAFLQILSISDLAVPSGGDVMADGSGFQPLIFDKEQVKMVGCFTAKERIGDFGKITPYCLVIVGRDFLQKIPAGYGVVINPGQGVGLDITPEGLANIVRDFS